MIAVEGEMREIRIGHITHGIPFPVLVLNSSQALGDLKTFGATVMSRFA
jgi:hypothetical protein